MVTGTGNVPEFLARKGDGPMTDDDLQSVVSRAITDSISYVDEELGPERAKATEYYHGKPLGNEEEGRSRAILTEVRDGILGVLPSILRVLHGPEHTVEYAPRRADGVAGAEQATDYIRYVYEEDNPGFLITHSTLKDGLLKKIGIVKWGMDEHVEVVATPYRGISREELAFLLSDESVTVTRLTPRPDELLDAELSRTERVGRIWVAPVPPDDFFWNREARSLDDAILIGHRTRLTRGELLAMGLPASVIDEHGGSVTSTVVSQEEQARRTTATSGFIHDPELGEANRRIIYCETYFRVDMDGDDVAELRKICTIGDQYHVVKTEPADSKPFAFFSPDPEPHTMLGGSWYDLLKDTQLIDSQLLRGMLDSLAISLFPRTAYVEGQASVADILNTAIGAPIRMRQIGMVQSFEQPFTGEKVLPVLGFMRDVIERRIGQKDGAGSLDMDALQSTGPEAVKAALTAVQAQAELLARLYAEQVMKPMFRGLLKLAVHPRSRERIVRLRGNYVPVHPATWDADMDVSVNVALGSMNTEKKIGVLSAVVADQSAILAQYGPVNPVVTLAMLRNAKAKILALQGVKDVDNYYQPVPPDWQPPDPPPKEPTPDELWIQAEKEMEFQKAMKELAIKEDELRLKERELEQTLALKNRELEIRAMAELEGQHGSEVERYKADSETAIRQQEIVSQERIALEKLAFETRKMELEAELRRYEADLRAATDTQTAQTTAAASVATAQAESAKPPEPPAEKAEPVVVNVMPAPAPVVHVAPAEVTVQAPRRGKRKGKITGPDGREFTVETED